MVAWLIQRKRQFLKNDTSVDVGKKFADTTALLIGQTTKSHTSSSTWCEIIFDQSDSVFDGIGTSPELPGNRGPISTMNLGQPLQLCNFFVRVSAKITDISFTKSSYLIDFKTSPRLERPPSSENLNKRKTQSEKMQKHFFSKKNYVVEERGCQPPFEPPHCSEDTPPPPHCLEYPFHLSTVQKTPPSSSGSKDTPTSSLIRRHALTSPLFRRHPTSPLFRRHSPKKLFYPPQFINKLIYIFENLLLKNKRTAQEMIN